MEKSHPFIFSTRLDLSRWQKGRLAVLVFCRRTYKNTTNLRNLFRETSYLQANYGHLDQRGEVSSFFNSLRFLHALRLVEMPIGDKQAYDTAKDMVDLRIDQIERYNDFLKEQRALRKS